MVLLMFSCKYSFSAEAAWCLYYFVMFTCGITVRVYSMHVCRYKCVCWCCGAIYVMFFHLGSVWIYLFLFIWEIQIPTMSPCSAVLIGRQHEQFVNTLNFDFTGLAPMQLFFSILSFRVVDCPLEVAKLHLDSVLAMQLVIFEERLNWAKALWKVLCNHL